LCSFCLFAYLFLATASHGVLDAMTNGGLGVAFFSPFDNRRSRFTNFCHALLYATGIRYSPK